MSERWDVGVEWVDAWKVSWVGGCVHEGGRAGMRERCRDKRKDGISCLRGPSPCRGVAQGPLASFTFRSRCSNSSRTRGRRPRKSKVSSKEVLLPDLHSE